MDIYLRKDCNWLKDSIQEITTSLCFTPRSCKIITLKHKTTNQKIIIANIHLCTKVMLCSLTNNCYGIFDK